MRLAGLSLAKNGKTPSRFFSPRNPRKVLAVQHLTAEHPQEITRNGWSCGWFAYVCMGVPGTVKPIHAGSVGFLVRV